jgi:large subunit ribosomal protein L18
VSIERKKAHRTLRRALRIRKKIKASDSLRVSVFRSAKHIYAQIIDDAQRKTLVSCSSLELKNITGEKTNIAHAVGKELAARALKSGVTSGVLDRGSFLYHGRVKALAEGLREGGLQI